MRVAIIHKLNSEKLANEVKNFLKENRIESELFRYPLFTLEKYDAIVTIGGDGTVLKSLHYLKTPPPVFSINTGRIGILTHATPESYRDRLIKALRGEIEVEEITRISGTTRNSEIFALNEIAVLSSSPARLLEFEVCVDNVTIDYIRADGAIIATPTGSTAYALSAGGPVVDPELDAMIFTPVSPFRIRSKPWVFSPKRSIEIRIKGERDAVAVADGITSIKLPSGSSISIKIARYPAKFFKFESRIERIAEKVKNLK